MSLTSDQVRAARALLRLRQDALANLSGVGLATIRRFETGSDIRLTQLAKLRIAIENAGAVLLDEGEKPARRFGMGVALRPSAELPRETKERIAAEQDREAGRIAAEKARRDLAKSTSPTAPPTEDGEGGGSD